MRSSLFILYTLPDKFFNSFTTPSFSFRLEQTTFLSSFVEVEVWLSWDLNLKKDKLYFHQWWYHKWLLFETLQKTVKESKRRPITVSLSLLHFIAHPLCRLIFIHLLLFRFFIYHPSHFSLRFSFALFRCSFNFSFGNIQIRYFIHLSDYLVRAWGDSTESWWCEGTQKKKS